MPPKESSPKPANLHPTDFAGCAYPPVGDEEREIRYLKRLKHLAARADAKGQAKEFAQLLRQRRAAGVPLPLLITIRLKDESPAQRNLSTLTECVCTIFGERLWRRALMLLEDSDNWYDTIFDILRCLYRNLRTFNYGQFMRVIGALECNCRLPVEVVELFNRIVPKFKESGGNGFASKALIKQHLSALLDEFIDLPCASDGLSKKMSMVALQHDIEETEALAKCVIAKPKRRPSVKLRKESDDADESLCKVKRNQPKAKSTKSPPSADPLANDDDWASDIDAEPEDLDFIEELIMKTEIKVEDNIDDLPEEDRLEDGPLEDFLYLEFFKVEDLPLDRLLDTREEMMYTADEIFGSMDHAFYIYDYEFVESMICNAVDKMYTRVIKRRIEAMSPMALFGTNESFPYVLRRGLLKNFKKEKPYMRKAPWGELPVRGSGTLEIVDDLGGVIKMEASYSPLNRKSVEDVRAKRVTPFRILMSQAMPAVVPCTEIFDAGYGFYGNIGGFSQYCNARGGCIWQFTSTQGNSCISLRLLSQMTPLIKALAEISSTPLVEYRAKLNQSWRESDMY